VSKDLKEYWRKNIRLMIWLLAVWAFVSYVLGILLVQPLNAIKLGGFPLGFWFAQQGSIYVFVILILVYCKVMKKVDQEYDVDE
jgi:putative solute:sodium symporter small subunit